MNILVTGARGFVGRNLVSQLRNIREGKAKNYVISPDLNVFEYDIDSNPTKLDTYCKEADFVFNLAGVNRPKDQSEFMKGNFGFATILLDTLKKYGNTCPVMISSSTQAALDNLYGESKRAGEQLMFDYAKETGAKVLVYRFPNVFGKWCRPNYNSAVATFCHNIAHNLPIQVNDPKVIMNLVYIDDVVDELIAALSGQENREGDYCAVSIVHTVTLGEIVDLLYSFRESRYNLSVPCLADAFTRKLYSTYLSYLPKEEFGYPLKMNIDERGSFTEIIRTSDRGQFSVNISKPHITKGNHWHHTKNEKFVVVSGRGVIRFRNMNEPDAAVIEYFVSGEKIEVIDIPTGYTHNIENLGDTDMVTFMWCNECFDPDKPDTYFEKV
ncbi:MULTISPECIES: capsular polysaccharide biosynthesis protein CapF [Bacteroides]|uniref:capsular polysaccharide biosynthesis protein CapF n=1 Tax=Bacteroides TaxID=816 RepID=UPI000E436DF6|nr:MULTISPECIES: capsular polysaccharide biosynthesis protein CapF [Bacteroides]RGM44062.1 NAD-dependent epimerase/dehydratase family protein [Bacteroides sp. OM08-11]